MKETQWRFAWLGAAALSLAWVASVQAEALKVVEVSASDHAAADKLAELVRPPFERAAGTTASSREEARVHCAGPEQIVVVLDSAHDAVRLLRCRDGAVLNRAIDPAAARATPYLAAFIAAELIHLNAELKDVRVSPLPASADNAGSARRSRLLELRLRAGIETLAVGSPFSAMPRPAFAAGLSVSPAPDALAWLVELQVSLLASSEQARASEQLSLQRNDARLRAGLLWPLGRLALLGALLLRGSVTHAQYRADHQTPPSTAALRFGLGGGVGAELALTDWLYAYAEVQLDVATSRSDYRIHGVTWASDPRVAVSSGLGLAARVAL
jgi:hypothetical protein